MELKEFFEKNKRVALGFSGGVDSSYLLYAGLKYGADIQGYYIKTAFQPEFEYRDAMRMAEELGANIKVVEFDILDLEKVRANPENRCYYCKTALFGLLKEQAAADGYRVVIDGTNGSDDWEDRPGMKALTELEVKSPLRECGLTKDRIRELSKEAGLFTWNKAAYACLATRIPSGEEISAEDLWRVESAESALFALGFEDFRVRVFHGAARLQLPEARFERAVCMKKEISEGLEPYFRDVFLDLKPR